jgi:hypothetical protein
VTPYRETTFAIKKAGSPNPPCKGEATPRGVAGARGDPVATTLGDVAAATRCKSPSPWPRRGGPASDADGTPAGRPRRRDAWTRLTRSARLAPEEDAAVSASTSASASVSTDVVVLLLQSVSE